MPRRYQLHAWHTQPGVPAAMTASTAAATEIPPRQLCQRPSLPRCRIEADATHTSSSTPQRRAGVRQVLGSISSVTYCEFVADRNHGFWQAHDDVHAHSICHRIHIGVPLIQHVQPVKQNHATAKHATATPQWSTPWATKRRGDVEDGTYLLFRRMARARHTS